MADGIDESTGTQLIEQVLRDVSSGNTELLQESLSEYHPAEQAHTLELD